MKNLILSIFFFVLFFKPSLGAGLTKDDLLKMSPSQIIVFAKNGDPLAQLWLGDAIYNGSIPNWNRYSSCKWYYKSAEQNNSEAALKLYHMIKVGDASSDCPKIIGIKKPNLDKNYWLLKSARLNNPDAQLTLFENVRSTDDENDQKIGFMWLKKAVKNNFPPAITKLAYLHLWGSYVERDIGEAIKLFAKASKLDIKNDAPDRELAEIYSNELYLNGTAENELKFKKGQINKDEYEATKELLKRRDYTNYFDIKKAILSAETCVQKMFTFRCYLMLINYNSEKIYNNVNYEEALMWLNEAEEVLKKSDFYPTILSTKGWAYLTWDNLKVDKLKAREYFQKALNNYKKLRRPSEKRIKLYETWISSTY